MTSESKKRRVRPTLEDLEGRELLSGGVSTPRITTTGEVSVSPDQQFQYVTPQGTKVDIRLYGAGSLSGTYVDPDGGLNLRFSGTNQQTGIIATVRGGTGSAPLRSLQSLTLQFQNPSQPSESLTGVGGSLINIVSLKNFNLVAGGRINLTSGVHAIYLNSVAADTQINLRQTPVAGTTVNSAAGSLTLVSPGLSVTTPNGTTGSSSSNSSIGTSSSSSTGTTTSSTNSIIATSTGSPTSSAAISALATSATQNGQTLTYSVNSSTGAQVLTAVSGQFTPTTNVVFQNITPGSPNPQPGAPPAPPGVVIAINQVNGPARSSNVVNNQPLGDPQIYAYDPTAKALIQFDTVTGQPVRSIPVALSNPAAEAGVALSQVNGTLLVLISDGQNVYAFNATTGAAAGQFSLSDLSASLTTSTGSAVTLTRLGTFNNQTVISDPTGGSTGLGLIQPINVAASLSSGQAQALTTTSGTAVQPFTFTRAFGLAGGLSGVPGLNTLYATGGGYLDTAQPNQPLLGVSSLGFSGSSSNTASLTESKRTEVTNLQGNGIATSPHGASSTSLNDALGSLGQDLTLFTGQISNGQGVTVDQISVLNPSSLATVQTFSLQDANPLSGLSGAFYPSLANAALIDVQGNTQSVKMQSAKGLIFNGEGNVNLVKIGRAVDTTIIGYPFGHAQIPNRTDVTIATSSRTVGDRNGVTILPNVQPTGPVTLPTP